MLKFIEICHLLNRQKHLVEEQAAVPKKMSMRKKLTMLLGFAKAADSVGFTAEAINSLRSQASIAHEIFIILREGASVL
jgi:hypothetical protein